MKRIDAHQHFWIFDPVRDAWIDESMEVIRRDFLPQDLEPLLEAHQLDGCVAVQADQSEEETHFLLDLASKHDLIKGVVGWVNLKGRDVEERIDRWENEEKLVGFRHILQAEEPSYLYDKAFRRGIKLLQAKGYCYDVLIFPDHLDATLDFVKAFPNLPMVVDHLAKPPIKRGELEPWASKMKALASHEHLCCKISGLLTEADWGHWKKEDFRPYLDHILEIFGPKRLLYGSDWPVCLLAGTYQDGINVVENYISSLSKNEQAAIMGANAINFYRLQ